MPTPEEQSQQQMTNAWMAKVDAMWEAMQNDVKREQEFNDAWKSFSLKQVEQNQQIVNRLAQDAATVSAIIGNAGALASARGTDAAAAMQNLVLAGALTAQISQNSMGAQVANQIDNAAKKAIDAAVAAVPGTSAASQGTSGVAQGAMQTGASVATVDLLTQVSKLAGAVDVLLAKVTALEVAAAKPAV